MLLVSGPGAVVVVVLSLQSSLQMSDIRFMAATAHAAMYAKQMACTQRWIAPQAGNEQGQQRQAQPALGAARLTNATIARMLRRLTLRIAHAVIDHAARTAHARDALVAAAKRIRCILAGATPIKLFAVKLVTIAAPHARLLLEYIRHIGFVQRLVGCGCRRRLRGGHRLRRLQSIALLYRTDRLAARIQHLCAHRLLHHRVIIVMVHSRQRYIRVIFAGCNLTGRRRRQPIS